MTDVIDHTRSPSRHRAATTVATGRARRLRATLVLALAACLVAGLAVASPALARVPRHFYGIVSATSLGGGDYERMHRARVGSLRFQVPWPAVQPKRHGPFYWTGPDQIVAQAAKHHIALLPILVGTPAYEAHGCSSCGGHIHIAGKGQRRDWQAFVRSVVKRYGRHGDFWGAQPDLPYDPITRYQIWNEQNNPKQRNSPKLYRRLLAVTDRAIRSVDARASTISGGMPGTTGGGRKTNAWRYLNSLYEHGAGKFLDGVALHPYSPNIAGIRAQIERIRRVMRRHHQGSDHVFLTELGWGSGGHRHFPGTGSRGQAFVVNAKQQKRKLARSFGLLTHHRRGWRIGGVYWFQWKDPKHPPRGLCAFCYTAGLYKADGRRAKPALSAYRRFTNKTG